MKAERGVLAAVGLVTLAFLLAGMSGADQANSLRPAGNVVPLTVRTPHSGFNRLVVGITVCEPGTTRCATIDDVMVDTGSTGLRLEASAVPAWLHLPARLGPGERPLAECLRFLHDNAWGQLFRADLRIGDMTVAGLPLQIISDDQRAQPAACPRSDVRPTSNGTLGIGPHLTDCPGSCEQSATAPVYFVDRVGVWEPIRGGLDRAYRLPNPVSLLPEHNNGVVFELPVPPDDGAAEVTGTLTFGVGTSMNNRPGRAHMVPLDATGHFTTMFHGRSYPGSYIDSGTESYILDGDQLPRCPGMAWALCATPELRLEAVMVGQADAPVPVSVKVGDFAATLARGFGASDAMAVVADQGSTAFVWGAPFFLGKTVTLVLDGSKVPGVGGAAGPFYAVDEPTASSPRP